jgi:hypothetical protein
MSQTKSQLINPIDGNINVIGIVTASQFFGNGTGLTGVASTDNIKTSTPARFLSNISVSGIATATTLDSSTFKNCNEVINVVGNTGTATTINLSNGNFVTATLTGNCTFTFNVGITTGAASFTLFLTNDATPGRSIVWPISVKWPNSSVPVRTTAANATDVYTFFTLNAGTNWYGNLSLYNYT